MLNFILESGDISMRWNNMVRKRENEDPATTTKKRVKANIEPYEIRK